MASESAPFRYDEPGPFRASQLPDGAPYELSNGHPIRCMPSSDRHAASNVEGAKVLATDPAVVRAGVDAGCAFNEEQNLRAPDIVVGNLSGEAGWAKGAPPLAVEYADRGQDEKELQRKVQELLAAGTQYIWVVRLVGPLRVEVYEPERRVRVVDAEGELTAPGILQNPVPVRALVDPEAANEATLRNLLNRKGYADLDAVKADGLEVGLEAGQRRGLRQAVYDLCEVLGIEMTQERSVAVEGLDLNGLEALRGHLKKARAWPAQDG